jgi:hypothetical protein
MPLRDHFHRPNNRRPNWGKVHGMWPAVLIQHLVRVLPPRYTVGPLIHVGAPEVDVAVHDAEAEASPDEAPGRVTATAVLPAPTLTADTDPPDADEFAARVYDIDEGERLVASVEFVSPANKDRPESRRMFVAKCADFVQQGVCVSVIDLVSDRRFNLYADLLIFLGHADPLMAGPPVPHLYAVTVRKREVSPRWQLETWAHPLAVGLPLPSIPLWWAASEGTLLDLEGTYEETCRTVRLTD